MTTSITEQLSDVLPAARLVPEAELPALAVDGCVPLAAVRPASVEELAAAVGFADRYGLAVCPRGGGSQLGLGLPPRRCDLVVCTGALDEIVEHEPADLTVTVQAGMTLARLQAALMARGQFLPLEPPLAERSTVGGMLATNASGPLRLAFGPAKERLIGARFVRADGVVAKSGGKVVKNVAGYDVHKLMIGALGTLAVLVEASFKIAPLPQAEATVIAAVGDAGAAFDLAGAATKGVWATLLALEVFDPGAATRLGLSARPGWLVLAQCGGTQAAVRRQSDELAMLARRVGGEVEVRSEPAFGEFWRRVRDFGRDGEEPAPIVLKAGVPPSRLGEYVATAAGRPDLAVQARAGSGLAYLYVWPEQDSPAPPVGELREVARRLGGHLVVERCPAGLKGAIDVWGPIGPEIALMRRIKAQFDPRGTLNPGRYVGGM